MELPQIHLVGEWQLIWLEKEQVLNGLEVAVLLVDLLLLELEYIELIEVLKMLKTKEHLL